MSQTGAPSAFAALTPRATPFGELSQKLRKRRRLAQCIGPARGRDVHQEQRGRLLSAVVDQQFTAAITARGQRTRQTLGEPRRLIEADQITDRVDLQKIVCRGKE